MPNQIWIEPLIRRRPLSQARAHAFVCILQKNPSQRNTLVGFDEFFRRAAKRLTTHPNWLPRRLTRALS